MQIKFLNTFTILYNRNVQYYYTSQIITIYIMHGCFRWFINYYYEIRRHDTVAKTIDYLRAVKHWVIDGYMYTCSMSLV